MDALHRFIGFYSTAAYLPASGLARRGRTLSRRLRGKGHKVSAPTRLPTAPWWQCVPPRAVRLYEASSRNGNVSLSELGILARFAADCDADTNLFEIGTFDGRTTLNLAMNAPATCRVITLDLAPATETRYEVVGSEKQYIDKPSSGHRITRYLDKHPALKTKIDQRFGDSATYDYAPLFGSCSLVFVDGSHAYDYARSDTAVARQLVKPGGAIVWHDYGVWSGVTRALEELEDEEQWGLRHIAGTSLVCWASPFSAGRNEAPL